MKSSEEKAESSKTQVSHNTIKGMPQERIFSPLLDGWHLERQAVLSAGEEDGWGRNLGGEGQRGTVCHGLRWARPSHGRPTSQTGAQRCSLQ